MPFTEKDSETRVIERIAVLAGPIKLGVCVGVVSVESVEMVKL